MRWADDRQADVVRRWRANEISYLDALGQLVRLGLPLWKADYLLTRE